MDCSQPPLRLAFVYLLAALPESIKRVGQAEMFPNEQPGRVYEFNWALNKDGVTPLYMAAQNGHLEVVRSLVQAGAAVNQVSPPVLPKTHTFRPCTFSISPPIL